MSAVKKCKRLFLGLFKGKDKDEAKHRLSSETSIPKFSHGSVTPAPNKILPRGDISDSLAVVEPPSANSLPHETVSNWTENIRLDLIFPKKSSNARIALAQEKLQKSTEQLGAALQKYSEKFDFSDIADDEIKSAIAQSQDASQMNSGEAFSSFVGNITAEQEKRKDTISSKVSSFIKQVCPVAIIALGVVSFAADAATFPPLKFTANGLAQVLTLASKYGDQAEVVVKGLDKLEDYQAYVKRVRVLDPSESTPEMVAISATAILLLVAITNFLRESVVYLKQSLLKAAAKAGIGDDAVKKSQEELDEAAKDFRLSISYAVDVGILEKDQLQHDKDLLEQLSKMDFKETQKAIQNKRLKGTCEWILGDPKFKQWLNGDLSKLWCPGTAGVGKTFLTSWVLDHIYLEYVNDKVRSAKKDKFGTAFVYCDWDNRSIQNTLNLIKSITRQLIEQRLASENWAQSRKEVKTFLEKHEATSPLLEDYLQFIPLAVQKFERVFIVVDALDELDSISQRKDFVDALLRIPDIQLFVTSRDNISPIKGSTTLEIRSDPKDIKAYVESRIKPTTPLWEPIQRQSTLKAKILDTVENKYENTFILVRLLMDHLEDQNTPGEVKDALKDLPNSKEDFYDKSLTRIREKRNSTSLLKVITWMLFAKRPLKMEELLEAVAFSAAKSPETDFREYLMDQAYLLESCAGLVVYEQGSETVKFAHLTVKEYLRRPETSQPSEGKEEWDVLRICLAYIHYYDTKAFKDSGLERYSLLPYACKYWWHYAISLCCDKDQHIIEAPIKKLAALLTELHCTALTLSIRAALGHKEDPSDKVLPSDLKDWLKHLDHEGLFTELTFDFESSLALHSASSMDEVALVKLMLDAGANVNSGHGEWTALHTAASKGHKAVVQLLLEAKADVGTKGGDDRMTALHLAAKNGHDAVVRLLLEQKEVDVNSKDQYGQSPLSRAAERGQNAVIRLLLEHDDTDANSKDEDGLTPLSWAAAEGYESVVKLLLDHNGIDTDSKDESGQTPLSRASERGQEGVVKVLLQRDDVDANSKDEDGQGPLSWAASGGREPVAKLLLEYSSINADSEDKYGQTPLSRASEKGHEGVVRLLLERDDVNVNSKDKSGRMPLWWATARGHKAVVKLLLEHKDIDEFGALNNTHQSFPSQENPEATVHKTSQNITLCIDLDSVIDRLLEVRGGRAGKQVRLLDEEIDYICTKAQEIFISQPILLELKAPVKIGGNVQGRYPELLQIFEHCGFPPETNYLFLGNYVDFGKQSLETICLLLAYKIKYPENFFMLRGRHEHAALNRIYGFYDECKRRYSIRLWKTFTACFNCMPIAAIVGEKIFTINSGLSPSLKSIEQIRHIRRPTDIPDFGLLCDLMWSSPEEGITGWRENSLSFAFGPDVVSRFLRKHGMDLICRSNDIVEDGYQFFSGQSFVTIFSASKYDGEFELQGAIMSVDEELLCSFQAS